MEYILSKYLLSKYLICRMNESCKMVCAQKIRIGQYGFVLRLHSSEVAGLQSSPTSSAISHSLPVLFQADHDSLLMDPAPFI